MLCEAKVGCISNMAIFIAEWGRCWSKW